MDMHIFISGLVATTPTLISMEKKNTNYGEKHSKHKTKHTKVKMFFIKRNSHISFYFQKFSSKKIPTKTPIYPRSTQFSHHKNDLNSISIVLILPSHLLFFSTLFLLNFFHLAYPTKTT